MPGKRQVFSGTCGFGIIESSAANSSLRVYQNRKKKQGKKSLHKGPF
jgi:hypothetical protein